MNIAVTGVSGFLGFNIVSLALKAGHHVIGVGRKSVSEKFSSNRFSEITFDLNDSSFPLIERLAKTDAFIHCAAVIAGTPQKMEKANVQGLEKLLDLVAGFKTMRFIFISSMMIFEPSPGPYGASKAKGEAVVSKRCSNFSIIRPTMIYGKNDPGWTAKIKAQASSRKMLFIPGGGRTKIQPVYVDDVAKAALAVGETNDAAGRVFNIGGPNLIEQATFLRIAGNIMNNNVRIARVPLLPLVLIGKLFGGSFKSAADFFGSDHPVDIETASKILGFKPLPPEKGLGLTLM